MAQALFHSWLKYIAFEQIWQLFLFPFFGLQPLKMLNSNGGVSSKKFDVGWKTSTHVQKTSNTHKYISNSKEATNIMFFMFYKEHSCAQLYPSLIRLSLYTS